MYVRVCVVCAVIMHSFLVKKARCLAMFATHYHSLVEEWGNHPEVCIYAVRYCFTTAVPCNTSAVL
jgi:DNA mismatch repair ATPase MutS